jgi:hypothetical protein
MAPRHLVSWHSEAEPGQLLQQTHDVHLLAKEFEMLGM